MEKDPCQAQVDLCQSLNQTFFYMAPYFVQIHPKMYIGSIHTGKDDPINIYFVLNGYQNSGAFHGQQGQSTEFFARRIARGIRNCELHERHQAYQ